MQDVILMMSEGNLVKAVLLCEFEKLFAPVPRAEEADWLFLVRGRG